MTAVIDLGEVGRRPPEPGPPAGRRFGRRPARPWLAVILVVVVLATVAAAAPPALPGPAYLSVGSRAQVVIDGGLLFVVDSASDGDAGDRDDVGDGDGDRDDVGDGDGDRDDVGDGGGDQTIAAYAVPGGDLRWRVPAPDHGDGLPDRAVVGVQRVDDVLLVSSFDPEGVVRTTAHGVHDGAVRWQSAGVVQGVTPDGALALWSPVIEDDPGGSGSFAVGSTVRIVEAASGGTRWQMTTSVLSEFMYRFDGGRLTDVVEIESGSRILVRDARTGRVRTTGTIESGQLVEPGRSWLAADLLVTMTGDTLSAFGLTGRARRWSVPAPPVSSIASCGPLICVTHSGGGVRALDPTDGTVRWAAGDWYGVDAFGRHLLAVPGRRDVTRIRWMVVDPATGEPAAVGTEDWSPVFPDGDGWLGLRQGPGSGVTWVARITPDGVPPRVLLRLADAVDDCQAGADVVVCRRVDGGLGVWALPD